MVSLFAEMPLALFTTFASIGAGAFIALAAALFTVKFDEAVLAKIDRLSLVPTALVVVGFIAAFFHLASPMNAFGVFAGLGSSPLSNEILAGVLFALVAIVYTVLALMGKLSEGSRKGFVAALAVLAVVFAVFMGLAYMMDTIASWNSIVSPVQMLGFALVGGAAVATLMLASAQAPLDGCKTALLAVLVAGAVLGAGGLAVQAFMVSGMENALVSGASLVNAAMLVIVVAVVGIIAACVTAVMALGGKNATVMAGISVACVFVGILCARLAFYAMQLSVGLYLL